MRSTVLVVPILLAQLGASANAAEPDRYQLEKTQDGYVRMDKRTGEISVCEERNKELVCRMAADERTAFQDELERLQTEVQLLNDRFKSVQALEDRVAQLENSLAARIEQSLPTEEDFDKTIGYMERFFRSFMSIVKEFEGESSKSPQPGANRT